MLWCTIKNVVVHDKTKRIKLLLLCCCYITSVEVEGRLLVGHQEATLHLEHWGMLFQTLGCVCFFLEFALISYLFLLLLEVHYELAFFLLEVLSALIRSSCFVFVATLLRQNKRKSMEKNNNIDPHKHNHNIDSHNYHSLRKGYNENVVKAIDTAKYMGTEDMYLACSL